MKRMFVLVAMALLVLFNVRSWAMEASSPMYGNRDMEAMRPMAAYNDMATPDDMIMREQLEHATQEFRLSGSYGEHALGQLLKLLSLECSIVHHLMRGAPAAAVAKRVAKRQKALHHSIPSVYCLYHRIMNVITYDPTIDPERLHSGYTAKQEFLHTMFARLQEYRGMYANLQYDEYMGSGNQQEMVM